MDSGSRRREIMTGTAQLRYVRTSRASFTPFCPCLHSAGSNLNRHRQMDSRNSPVDLRSFRLTRPKRLSPARKWRPLLFSNAIRNARKRIGWIRRKRWPKESNGPLYASPRSTKHPSLINSIIIFFRQCLSFLSIQRAFRLKTSRRYIFSSRVSYHRLSTSSW